MTFPTTISAHYFSALAVSVAPLSTAPTTESGWETLFALTSDFTEIKNIRDMPSFGTPSNVVKVPTYGQSTTQSIGAQADAPDLDLTINFVADDWKAGSALGGLVGNGVTHAFQFSLLSAKPTSLAAVVGGLGSVANANVYFLGKVESLLVNPARDDATTATVALSIQSAFSPWFTVT